MNRIEQVRKVVDKIILNMEDNDERRSAYIHLYGVQAACSLLAIKRGINLELAIIAGLLHDIYSYAYMDSHDHARKGSEMARRILESIEAFKDNEVNLICTAISNHSEKQTVHNELDEILKDADVMQHYLYSPTTGVRQHEQMRVNLLRKEFNI